MVEAKDTVKTYGELRTYCIGDMGILEPTDTDLKIAQVLISFKVGYNQALKEVERLIKQARDEGFKAGRDSRKDEIEGLMAIAFADGERMGKQDDRLEGIREVVETIGKCCYICHDQNNNPHTSINKEDWQAKLKEWGL